MQEERKSAWWRRVRIEEWLAVFLFSVVTAVNVSVSGSLSWKDSTLDMLRYFSFGNSFYVFFSLALYLVFFFWGFRAFAQDILGVFIDRKPLSRGMFVSLGKALLEPVRILFPIALVSVSFFTLLTSLNVELIGKAQDVLLYYADKSLLGFTPFISLPLWFDGAFAAGLFFWVYITIGAGMSIALITLFFESRWKLFRLNLLSFMLVLPLAFPLYYILPCQDPGNAFLYHVSPIRIPGDIQDDLGSYAPSAEAARYAERIHASELDSERSLVPISCFPSMHAAWSFMTVFFLALFDKRSLILSVPWILLLLTGGLYFAQHYFIDYLVAIPLAAISIMGAHFFLWFEKRYLKGDSRLIGF